MALTGKAGFGPLSTLTAHGRCWGLCTVASVYEILYVGAEVHTVVGDLSKGTELGILSPSAASRKSATFAIYVGL